MADCEIEELHTPTREWKGWIRNRMTHELEWCIVTAGLMGVFRDPEADRARIVLNLADFHVKPLCEGAKRGSHVFTYVDDCYSIKFVSKRNSRMIYTFGAETEDDFRTWYRGLTGLEVEPSGFDFTLETSSSSSPTSTEVKSGHNDARRMDSGLGDDICTSPGASRDGRASNSRVRQFDTIQETQAGTSLNSSGKTGNVTPDSSSGKSESSDSLSDSGQSNTTTPDSELADEVPRLRANAHKLRVTRTDQSRFSAPVGDFSLWEEVMGEDGILKKTYSLPMKSPHRVRASSDGEEVDAFEYEPSSQRSQPDLPTAHSATNTPTNRRPGPVTSFSDPAKSKKLGSRMTVKASRFVGRMTHLRSQRNKTPLTQSAIINITIEGDLLRKHKSTLVPCYCILSGSVLYCYKSKESEDLSDLTIDINKYRLSKLTAAKTESKELDCAIVLTAHSSSKEHVFIAKDLNLARKWYGHVEDILKELESRQIKAMQNSAPDLRGSLPLLNQTGKYSIHQQSKYAKVSSKTRGSTFKRLAQAEQEKRNSMAARMSRASFEDGYGYTEDMSRRHRASMDDILGSSNQLANHPEDDEDEEAFIEITMDEIMRAKSNLGDRAVSRSMDDIGMTSSVTRNPLMTGKSPLGLGRTTPKTKRHKRVVPIPASEVENPVKTGYLEVKKSGSWKRCWSILTADRLYIYRKPTDSHTLDMLMLDEYDVQTVVSSSSSSKTGNKFAFELYHPKVTGTQLLCETSEERADWVAAIEERCKKYNGEDMDGTTENKGSREKLAPLITRLDSDPGDKQTHLGVDNKGSGSSTDVSDASPIMERKKQYIEDKYERVKEAQEAEMLRVTTILNQRRMSADVKINAVEKKLQQQRKQRKRKKNSRGESLDEEEAFLEEQMEQLKTRLEEINKESQETNLKQEERLKAIEAKKDVEFKILEQERKLQKHRKAAQQALQQIVKGISSITPPVGGSRPRFDQISEEAEDESEERKLSVASSVGISSSDSMGSLGDPKKSLDSEVVLPVRSAATASAPLTRRQAVHRPPKLSAADSSTDSSSSIDSPDVVRHNFNLVDEFTKSFPAFDGTLEQGSRDKSKSFDSGIADEVDINSNRPSAMTTTTTTNINNNINDNERSSPIQPIGKHIRTEVSEDVLRDIEEFEMMARRALEEASWMV